MEITQLYYQQKGFVPDDGEKIVELLRLVEISPLMSVLRNSGGDSRAARDREGGGTVAISKAGQLIPAVSVTKVG